VPALRADDVYGEVKQQAKDAILAAIDKERDGEQIDRSLLKNVLGIFIEVRTPPACLMREA
jgi:cullin 1